MCLSKASWVERGADANAYRYNGIEHLEEYGLDLAFYRSYDPAIGRWNAVDPLADKYGAWSAYNYVMGNPLKFIDPDGKEVVLPNQSQADALANDLNRIYENKYGVSDAYRVVARDVEYEISESRWYNPASWNSTRTETRTHYYLEINPDSETDWDTDKYTEKMQEIVESEDTEILVRFIEDKGSL